MKARLGAAVVAVAAIAIVTSCSVPVGDLGGATSEAYGINDAGVVVGSSETADSTPANRIFHGFARHADGTVVDLVPLAGHSGSLAKHVNTAGTVVGTSRGGAPDRVVVWDAAGQVTDLGFSAFPFDINDAGVVVGSAFRLAGDTEGHAFVYDPAVGHAVKLPELAGAITSFAWGLNDAGQAVGSVSVGAANIPVRWDLAAGTVTDLRAPTGLDTAMDINDAGTIAGSVAQFTSSSAAVWMPGSAGPTALGVAGNGRAYAVNDAGVVVGASYIDPRYRSFRWESGTGAQWLGSADAESIAYALNATGSIVGYVGKSVPYALGTPTAKAVYLFPS